MKRSRVREMSMEVTVGAFMFMILLALGYFTIIMSSENLFKTVYPLTIRFDNVMGLREGDKVFVRGVDLGKIDSITAEEGGVKVISELIKPVTLYEDYKIEILQSSVLGGRYLSINEGTSNNPPVSADAMLTGSSPIDLVDEASKTIMALKDALTEGGILENLKKTMAQLHKASTRIGEGEGTLGKLIHEEDVYESLQKIATNLEAVSQRLADGKGTIGKLLSEDDELYRDLKDTVKSFREMSSGFSDMTANLNKKEGTLGKLINDDELYEETKRLLQEARAAINDIRETSPIVSFSSIFFGSF